MSNFDEKPGFIHENRRLEEAHDRAMENLTKFWVRKYSFDGTTDVGVTKNMYSFCSNGDEILCDEAQDIFNEYYEVELETEMHV